MRPSLSPRTYLAFDRLTKIAAVVLLAAALGGVTSSTVGSILLGGAGLVVGLVTVFVKPEGETRDGGRTEQLRASATVSDADGFLGRFTHPWVALIAIIGILLLVGDFLIAAVGVLLRRHDSALAVNLFQLSGVVGVLGLVLIVAPGVYVGALYVRRLIQ